MKCPVCNGKGYYEVKSSYGVERVECGCHDTQTNEEWLKSTKDTNQFACEMCELFEILCTDCKFYDKSMRIGGCTLPRWLKEVHK